MWIAHKKYSDNDSRDDSDVGLDVCCVYAADFLLKQRRAELHPLSWLKSGLRKAWATSSKPSS